MFSEYIIHLLLGAGIGEDIWILFQFNNFIPEHYIHIKN